MKRREWEKASAAADDWCDITAHDIRGDLRRLVRSTPVDQSTATLIDLGCGIGTFIGRYGAGFQRIVGVDFSAPAIARAPKRCAHVPHARWVCADISRAADEFSAAADVTTCFNVVTSPSVARRRQILRAVAQITRPGGYSLLVVPAAELLLAAGLAYQTRPDSGDGPLVERDGTWQKYFTRREIRALLSDMGYTVISVRRIRYPWSEEVADGRRRGRTWFPWDWGCLATRRA